MASTRPNPSTHVPAHHDDSSFDVEAQRHDCSNARGHTGGMVQTTSNSLFGFSSTSASTVYEREREPQHPAPVHHVHSNRAPAPAPIEIPATLPHALTRAAHSSDSLQPLTQPAPQSTRSAIILQKTRQRHKRSFVRRHEPSRSSIWASCFPSASHSPSIRSKVLQCFLCFLLLAGVFAVYLGLSLSNEHLSTGVQVPLLVLLILCGILFVYVIVELCIFAQRVSRVGGHHRLRSTVSFQIDEREGDSHHHHHHHHQHGRHKHRQKRQKRRYRRGEYPQHQIPVSPDDALPNDDAVYTPTTPVRVHLLHDEESVVASEKRQFAPSHGGSAPGEEEHEAAEYSQTIREMVDISTEQGMIDESLIHPSLRRFNTGDTIPIGPTSPVRTSFHINRSSSQQRAGGTGSSGVVPAQREAEETVVLGKAPPPAYGLWRCSVRADPNLLHWRRIDSLPSSTGSGSAKPTDGATAPHQPQYYQQQQQHLQQQQEDETVGESAAEIAASMLRPRRYQRPSPPESEPPAYVSFVHSSGGDASSPPAHAHHSRASDEDTTHGGGAPPDPQHEPNNNNEEEDEEGEEGSIVMIAMGSPQIIPAKTYTPPARP